MSLSLFSSKTVQSTPTHVPLPDRHLVLSDSTRKPGTVTLLILPGFKNCPPSWEWNTQILYLSSLQRIIIQVNLPFWTLALLVSGRIVVICHLFWTPTQPTSISITHLLKHVNKPSPKAAKWRAAFTTCSRRCNKAGIRPLGLARAAGRMSSSFLGRTNDIWVLGGCHRCLG